MKFVTFNIRCDYGQDGPNSFCFRKEAITEKWKQEAPDVICFQEVLPHTAKWMKEEWGDYYIIGCGRSQSLRDEQVPIAYKKTALNLISMDTFWLSDTPDIPGSRFGRQSICPRVCIEAVFEELSTASLFRVVNLHLDHEEETARLGGVELILNRLDHPSAFPGIPVIVAGDFNAPPHSPEVRAMEGFVDAAAGSGGTFHDFGECGEPEKIDYLFASREIWVKGAGRYMDCQNGVYLSDHYPLWAELGLPPYEGGTHGQC